MLRISAAIWRVDGRDAGGRAVGREDVAAGLAGERLERRVASPLPMRDRVDGDAAGLGGLDGSGRAWSWSCRRRRSGRRAPWSASGAVPSSLAGLDHGVVERRALLGVERDLVQRGRRARWCRCRAPCTRVRLVPEGVDATSSRPCAWPSRTRRRPACAAAQRRALHRAADVDRNADGGRRAAARLRRR